MTEVEFIERLKNTPFSREEYLRIGLDEDFISEKISAYNPPKRIPTPSIHGDDPLIRLITGYDVSNTEIGMIWFGSQVSETEDYFNVGKFEADLLCISKFSKEIVIVPFDDPLIVAYQCAQNSFLFLEATICRRKILREVRY